MVTTMAEAWLNVNPIPEGLIDHLVSIASQPHQHILLKKKLI